MSWALARAYMRQLQDEAIVSLLRFYKEHGAPIKEIKELGFSQRSYMSGLA